MLRTQHRRLEVVTAVGAAAVLRGNIETARRRKALIPAVAGIQDDIVSWLPRCSCSFTPKMLASN